MNEQYQPDREPILETGVPVKVGYSGRSGDRRVKIFTFNAEDNRRIRFGTYPFIVTCSRENYPELRPLLAQALGSFVTRVNPGANGNFHRGLDDVLMNPDNSEFRGILRGSHGRDTELFIIPLKRNMDSDAPQEKKWVPTGGVKFVTKRYGYWAELGSGTLNLVAGDRHTDYRDLFLDEYHGEPFENDYVGHAL